MFRTGHFLMCFLLIHAWSPAAAIAKDDPSDSVKEAIDSIRGLKFDGLNEKEAEALAERLDKAWDVLQKHEKIAVREIRRVLAEEREDSLLIIDLSNFLMRADFSDRTLIEIAGYVAKVDPSAYSHGFFDVASVMSSRKCVECLPAVLKMLEIRHLNAYIEEHALSVDILLGMLFTIGQYGDDAIDEVLPSLQSTNCVVRHNAIMILGNLLALEEPVAFRRIALEDPCAEARTAAWFGLAMYLNPERESMALIRLSATPSPVPAEKERMALVLSTVDSEASRTALQKLSDDSDPNVSRTAKEALEEKVTAYPATGSVDQRARRKIVGQLKKAVKTGYLAGEPEISNYLASLEVGDLPLVNSARASVLQRVSDECLYEWYPLRAVARWLRVRGSAPSEKGEVRSPE